MTVSVKVYLVNAATEGAVKEAVADEPPVRVTVGPETWDQLYERSPEGKDAELSALPESLTDTPGRVVMSGPALAAKPERVVPVPAPAVPLLAGAEEVGVVVPPVQALKGAGAVASGHGLS